MDGLMNELTDGQWDGPPDGRKKCGRIDGPFNQIFSSDSNLIVDEFLERKHGNAICMLKSEMSMGSEDLTQIANT